MIGATAPTERRRILVAADDARDGLAGVELISRLALSAGDEVIAVTMSVPLLPVSMGTSAVSGAPGPWLLGWPDADAAGDAPGPLATLLGRLPCVVRTVVREGNPSRAIREAADEAAPDLVVVSESPPRGRLEAFLFGDPWRAVLEEVPAPVLVARPRPDTDPAPIVEDGPPATAPGGAGAPLTVLVAIDDPGSGADAIRELLRLPIPADAQVLVLAIVPESPAAGASRLRRRMARRLHAAVRMLRAAGHRAAPLVTAGDATRAVLDAATSIDADVVVVGGGHGRGQGRLGSLARSLVRTLPVGVLVVPAGVPRHVTPRAAAAPPPRPAGVLDRRRAGSSPPR